MQHPLVRPSLAPYGFAYRQFTDRLDFKPKHDPYYVNAERLMARFWDRRHRLDATSPFPIETIIHRILPGQQQANRLFHADFEFKGLPYQSRDIALLSSIMYWFGTNVGACFLECAPMHPMPESRRLPPLKPWREKLEWHPEREFLKKYRQKMRERDMVVFWGHQCTKKCSEQNVTLSPFVSPHAYVSSDITARDRAVVEGLMTWLGSKDGRSFTTSWLAHLRRARDAARAQQARDLQNRTNVA